MMTTMDVSGVKMRSFVKGVKVTCRDEKTAVFLDNAQQAVKYMRLHETEQGHSDFSLMSTDQVKVTK